MFRASWNGVVIAESEATVVVEGNRYFPPESLRREYVRASTTKSLCLWKGIASYYLLIAHGATNPDAAWYYPHPTPFARRIKNHVAFWQGVRVDTVDEPPWVETAPRRGGLGVVARLFSRRAGSASADPAVIRPGDGPTSIPGPTHEVLLYWRPGCGASSFLASRLAKMGVPVRAINIWESAPAAATVRSLSGGFESVPTVVVAGLAMVEPSVSEVVNAIRVRAPHLLGRRG
ncbi:MAG: hypothetical protein NVSMB32_07880 [Actinomycetota bacterium]